MQVVRFVAFTVSDSGSPVVELNQPGTLKYLLALLVALITVMQVL